MPAPQPNEDREDFIERCMSDQTMENEYEDEEQRHAVCRRLWEERPAGALRPGDVERGTATFETAGWDPATRRIRDWANTFTVMRSGRLIHPTAADGWLAGQKKGLSLALLAPHGYGAGPFATIGKVDVLRVDPRRGLYFEAVRASGTEAADQAATLIGQGMLTSVSLGWIARKGKIVRMNDADLDPWIGQQLRLAGVNEAYVHYEIEPVEISLVDVGDDPGARLAASLRSAVAGELADLRSAVAAVRAMLERLTEPGATEVATVRAAIDAEIRSAGALIENALYEAVEAAADSGRLDGVLADEE